MGEGEGDEEGGSQEGGEEESGEEGEVRRFEWSRLFTFRLWSVFWKVTLLYWAVLHLYVTRLAYVAEGFWTGAFILIVPIFGDQAICWGSGRLPLIRALQTGVLMLLASWIYYVCLGAYQLLPGLYTLPSDPWPEGRTGATWQRHADGSWVCVQWPRSFHQGLEYEFDPETGVGTRLRPAPAAPAKP